MTGKYTAIARRKPSSPMILLRDEIFGECLDYGCGRGFDCDYFGIDGYDPNWRNEYPTKKYDRIFCNFVINVVSADEEKEILSNIYSLLKPKGKAYITVRRDIKKDYVGRDCIQRLVFLGLPVYREIKNRFCIYVMSKSGYDKKEKNNDSRWN